MHQLHHSPNKQKSLLTKATQFLTPPLVRKAAVPIRNEINKGQTLPRTLLALMVSGLLSAGSASNSAQAQPTKNATTGEISISGISIEVQPSNGANAVEHSLQVGTVEFEATVRRSTERSTTNDPTGVAEVRFELNGAVEVQRRLPPFTASIHLGRLPQEHIVAATAFNEAGEVLARDEIVLNRRLNSFSLRFIEPDQPAQSKEPQSEQPKNEGQGAVNSGVSAQVAVELDVNVPGERSLRQIDLFLNEQLVDQFTEPPFSTQVTVEGGRRSNFLRAVARLDDGNATEEIVFLNGPQVSEQFDVQYVQLYLSALDRKTGRPIQDLQEQDFSVEEDGKRQELRRFEKVTDLPLSLTVLLDVSASMEPSLTVSSQAARSFFDQTMKPSDRATLVTFNDRPQLRVPLTANPEELKAALNDVKAIKGTALYDSLVFALYQLSGVKGQRAALLFSDGSDENSTLRYEDALEYSRRAGIPIYAVRLEQERKAKRAREELRALSEATGGRAFFVDSANELEAIYAQISNELRSRYLATYQSSQQTTNRRFREIVLSVQRKGIEINTQRGYYP